MRFETAPAAAPAVPADKPQVSIVLPCYNDAPHLAGNVREIMRTMDTTRWPYEIILVNDKSPDNCEQIIDGLVEEFPGRVFKLSHEVNKGRGMAVANGMRMARGEFAGFLDVDLEVHCRYIPSLVLELEDGADVVCARRVYKMRLAILHRAILSKGYIKMVNNLLDVDMEDTEAGYKFFRRETILPVLLEVENDRWFWDTEIMVRSARNGLRVSSVPVLFLRKPEKKSTVKLFSDTMDYLKNLWRFRRQIRKRGAKGNPAGAPSPASHALQPAGMGAASHV